MTSTRLVRFSAAACAALALGATTVASAATPIAVWTQANAEGGRAFAASLPPIEPAAVDRGVDLVVVFDTSASQVGAFRETGLAAVESLVAALAPADRVQVVAADLEARPMTSGPTAPDSPELAAAMDRLGAETPLGTTNIDRVLRAATALFGESERERALVYIGDGFDSTGLSAGHRWMALLDSLRAARVPVTSYAIGPRCDQVLLMALANQTGGNVAIDEGMTLADESEGVTRERATADNVGRGGRIGRTLADWAHARVEWPQGAKPASGVVAVYPTAFPPLRSDRDTILVGSLASDSKSIGVAATVGGDEVQWAADASAADESAPYLSTLVSEAARNGGQTLTTLGTAGLEATGRVQMARIDELAKMAERAVSLGDKAGAAQLSDAVLRHDPGNPSAETVRRLTVKGIAHREARGKSPFRFAQFEVIDEGAAGEQSIIEPAPVVEGTIVEGDSVVVPGDTFFEDTGAYPPAEVVVDGRFLDSVDRNSRVFAQMMEKETQNAIADARGEMGKNPERAIQGLKLMLQNVERSPELIASVRVGLVDKIQSALREAARQASIKDDLDREREETLAAAREQRILLDRLTLQREREKQLIDRFNALVDERRFDEAVEVAEIANEIDPEGVTPRVAYLWGQAKRYYEFGVDVRAKRAAGFLETMASIETSSIPFPGDPPIVYPDPEFWAELTERRKQYASVDLAGKSESEEAINTALNSPLTATGMDFQETPLEEVVQFLRDEYAMEVLLDTKALEDLGIGPDEPVTSQLRNITLRSAMRLILKPLELTYVIDEEVLLITTEDEALTRLSVKVYPVADLVLPIISQGMGGMGGMMGGGGGGMGGGGMGGGGGGMGGGMGGGGGGMGGGGGGMGGGMFSVPDDLAADASAPLSLTRQPAAAAPSASPAAGQPKRAQPAAADDAADRLELPAADASPSHWEGVFANGVPSPVAVRHAARRLMADRRYDHVAALIDSALRHGAPQPWMYESLGIAMKLEGRKDSEVERAVMSAVDFAQSNEQLLAIADYLSGMDLDRRAVEVCQLATSRDPLLYEGYALALRAAKRCDDIDALAWATTAIVSQAWPTEQAAIAESARLAGEALVKRLEEQGDTGRAQALRDELNAAAARDCVVRVSWTGEADVDVAVQEPGGSLCWLGQPRTTGGGVNLGDSMAADASDAEHTESYVCPRGFSGAYRVAIRKVWGEVTADTVTVEVTLAAGTDREETIRKQIAIEQGKDAVVEFSLADGRRSEPLEEERLAQAISRQQAVSQAVLGQQLSSLADGGRGVSLRPADVIRRRLALGGGGAVGYQPVIITLPDGTNMSTTAVISADRRYVRVTPTPFFSGVSSVATFSFTGAPAAITNNTTNNTTSTATTTNVAAGGGDGQDAGGAQ
ncbi:MAG: hypothetical protein ACRCT8_17850 [Lacipirellulaceae bacterium]